MPKIPNWNATSLRWKDWSTVAPVSYQCGYCGDKVTSEKGHQYYNSNNGQIHGAGAVICPRCLAVSFVYPDTREVYPSPVMGNAVAHVPKEVNDLYSEARNCTGHANHTACILLCRKILMHIAVAQGALPGLNFMQYVEHLSNGGYVPPNGKHWVDHIRKKGNEANHEIVIMTETDSKELLGFIEMLLRFIYEFPNSIPKT